MKKENAEASTAHGLDRRQCLRVGGAVLSGITLPFGPARAAPATRARLSLNENPFGPSPLAISAVQEQLDRLDRYVANDADAFIEQIAAREQVSSEQIILGEILDVLGLQLALDGGPGGEFIYSEPGYTALVNAVAPGGGTVVGVPLNGALENDLPAMTAKVNARTRAIYIVNPHNPTGTVSEVGPFKAFIKAMAERTLVIVDEAYLEFEPDFAERTAVDLTRSGSNVIVYRTFGKIYGLAGLSIGYAVAPKNLAAFLKDRGIGDPLELNRLAIAAASASLRDADYIAATREKVAAEKEKWIATFHGLKCRYADSKGNFVFFETGQPHEKLAAGLLAEGIDIGRSFPPFDTWARISIGLPQENLLARKAVEKLVGRRNP
jgi:histidinol-phosphate aminotransferase